MMDRRQFVKAGGLALAGAATGAAGCSSISGGLTGGGAAANWLAAPSVFGADHFSVTAASPASLSEYSRDMTASNWESLQRFFVDGWEFARFQPSDLDRVLRTDPYSVLLGDFDEDRVVSSIERDDYVPAPEHNGFDLYQGPDERSAVAVSGDAIVRAKQRDVSATESAKLVIDAFEGEQTRYGDVNEDFSALTDALDLNDLTAWETSDRTEETDPERGDFENQVASGITYAVDGEETDVTMALVFVDERDVYERDVRDWIQADDAFDAWLEVEESSDGRVAYVEGAVRTRDLLEASPN